MKRRGRRARTHRSLSIAGIAGDGRRGGWYFACSHRRRTGRTHAGRGVDREGLQSRMMPTTTTTTPQNGRRAAWYESAALHAGMGVKAATRPLIRPLCLAVSLTAPSWWSTATSPLFRHLGREDEGRVHGQGGRGMGATGSKQRRRPSIHRKGRSTIRTGDGKGRRQEKRALTASSAFAFSSPPRTAAIDLSSSTGPHRIRGFSMPSLSWSTAT